MGVFSNNAITDGGRVLLSYVEMGAIFTPTKIVMGSGTLPAGTTVRTIKDVVAPVKTLTIGKKKRGNDGTVTIGGVYSNQDVTADFYFRELALYARADNQDGSVAAEECLYSYGNAGSTADLMPAYSSGQPVERQIDLVIYVGNDSNVDLTIASGTAMTVEMGEQMVDGLRKEVGQALEGKAEKTHTHTSKDITGLDEAMSGALEGKADKEHTHTKKDITDFPESMPASDVHEWAKQPNKPTYTANEVGAAPSGHTHTAGQISGLPTSLPASDVYPWAKQPNKPAYTAGEVGAAPSGHTHDDRYYTEAEVNNLLSAIKTRLTKLEGSVDMAKLVYTLSCNGISGSTVTYANADFIVVKPVGLVSSTTSNSAAGNVAATSQVAPSDGYKIMKGCSGQATVGTRVQSGYNDSYFNFSNATVNYGSDGAVTFPDVGNVYCNIEFYKQ